MAGRRGWRGRPWLWSAVAVLAGLGAVSGLLAALGTWWLAAHYRPTAGDRQELPQALVQVMDRVASTDRWLGIATGLAVATALAAVVGVAGKARPLRLGLLAASLVAVLAAAVVQLTVPVVRWTQLGLDAVMTGVGLEGYRAVTSADVAFVLADGTVRSPEEASRLLDAHLVAGFLLPLALVVACVLALLMVRPTDCRRDEVEVATSA